MRSGKTFDLHFEIIKKAQISNKKWTKPIYLLATDAINNIERSRFVLPVEKEEVNLMKFITEKKLLRENASSV